MPQCFESGPAVIRIRSRPLQARAIARRSELVVAITLMRSTTIRADGARCTSADLIALPLWITPGAGFRKWWASSELRRAKGLMADEARTLMSDPLYYEHAVRLGQADGSVARRHQHMSPHECARRFTASAFVRIQVVSVSF